MLPRGLHTSTAPGSSRPTRLPYLQRSATKEPGRLDSECFRQPDERLDAEVYLRDLNVLQPSNVELRLLGERRLAESQAGSQPTGVRGDEVELLLRLRAPHTRGGTAASQVVKRGSLHVLYSGCAGGVHTARSSMTSTTEVPESCATCGGRIVPTAELFRAAWESGCIGLTRSPDPRMALVRVAIQLAHQLGRCAEMPVCPGCVEKVVARPRGGATLRCPLCDNEVFVDHDGKIGGHLLGPRLSLSRRADGTYLQVSESKRHP